MIQSVMITNHAGESIELELRFPEKSGFLIQDIDGLGPSKATINSTEMASNDGAIYNSAHLLSRNILITLAFSIEPSVEENRLKSYRYFPIKKPISIRIKTDKREAETYGYVESNDIDIFSKAEKCLISLICPDPYFYSILKEYTVFANEEGVFEFPFSNESLTEKLLIMSILHSDTIKVVKYSGDAPVGVRIYVHALGVVHNLRIFNLTSRESININSDKLILLTGSDIKEGDDIIISTIRGEKYIYLVRDGVETNILNCVGKDVSWFQLQTGDNILAYTADVGIQNLQFRVENNIVYEGI